jgi:hypothetical protein
MLVGFAGLLMERAGMREGWPGLRIAPAGLHGLMDENSPAL